MDKQKVIICGLDGTLFDCEERRKKYLTKDKMDYDAFNAAHVDDEANKPLEILLNTILKSNLYTGRACFGYISFLFVSGREGKYFNSSYEQIIKIFYSQNLNKKKYSLDDIKLFMRKTGDYREDEVIKKEIYEEHIKDKYDVLFCIDDRPKVCRMWRELGLFCFQVNDK